MFQKLVFAASVFVLVVTACVGTASAVYVVNLQDGLGGYTGTQDARLLSFAGGTDLNLGTETAGGVYDATDAASWHSEWLIKFDLSSLVDDLAAGNTVQSATLSWTIGSNSANSGVTNTALFRITQANADWIEGTKNATPAGAGEPNYEYRQSATARWAGYSGSGPGSTFVAGTDYHATALDTNPPVPDTAPPGGLLTFDFGDVSFFSDWINNPANNAGFNLRSTEGLAGYAITSIHTSEAAEQSLRPILSITFAEPVPEPSTFALLGAGLLGSLAYARRKRK